MSGTAPWQRVRAPNPGPMTLDGTNSYVVSGPDGVVVVDPGPDHAGHRAAVLAALGPGRVLAFVLTHQHPDHTEGVPALRAALSGAVPVLAATHGPGVTALVRDGDAVGAGLRVLLTPGHTGDSLSLVLEVGGGPVAVLTGDTVLGRGSSIVAHPDGALGPYLDSLRRLAAFGALPGLPGHGPELPDVATAALGYLAHREQRLAEVRAALAAGAVTTGDVVAVVYAEVDRALWPAAAATVEAQLAFLRAIAGG